MGWMCWEFCFEDMVSQVYGITWFCRVVASANEPSPDDKNDRPGEDQDVCGGDEEVIAQ